NLRAAMRPPALRDARPVPQIGREDRREAAGQGDGANDMTDAADHHAGPTDGGALPLSGITVLDATHVLAGPFATYRLALLGADVVRVERLAGDDFVRHPGGTERMEAHGVGASFLSRNASKRSIAINLKDSRGAN